VSCKGACDAASPRPLPPACPAACESFRAQPDALERAAALDAQYRNKPPLDEMPLYCIPVVFKDPYDTKDMRSTANNDVAFEMDAPPFDSTLAAMFRKKGAIIYAKGNAHEFNAGPGNPGGSAVATRAFPTSAVGAISSWSGQSCNPYDTEREPRGSSSGPGVAIGANLAAVGICEQTFASCQGPASKNNIVNILPTSGILPDAGGIGNQFFIDRPGIYGKTVKDAAIVLDAVKDPKRGYFDPLSIYTASPKALVPAEPYASFVVDDARRAGQILKGKRVALVRDFMVKVSKNDEEISDTINAEAKRVLRDQLGAELVESFDPLYGDDPDVPNMAYTFQDAYAEVIPRLRPELFQRTASGGGLLFAVPGFDVTSYDYLLSLTLGTVPISANLNLRTLTGGSAQNLNFKFDIERYLKIRGDAKVKDWASWVANAKFRQDASVVAAQNWLGITTNIDAGKEDQLAISMVGRLAVLKAMYENDIDVFVNPEITTPPRRIGRASDPTISDRSPVSCCGGFTATLQLPQIVVPAGYVRTVYEPGWALNAAKNGYVSVSGTTPSPLPNPMPIGMMFWGAPGDEPTLITVASAYEAATKHRVPPPRFGPVPGEP
jgi:Asp-tRNA(Asn)/Glu-tRNA(Gln) amidotransferase A subunit family amidase